MGRPRPNTSLAYRQLWEDLFDAPEWLNLPAGPASPRLLLLFLAVGPIQRAVPGVLLAGEGEIADRLGWSSDDVRACMAQLEEIRAARIDREARLIWLPWKYDHEPPASPDVVRGSSWFAVFERWPRGALAAEARDFIGRKLAEKGPLFTAAFESLPKPADTVPLHRAPPPPPPSLLSLPVPPPSGDTNESANPRISESSFQTPKEEAKEAADEQPPAPGSQLLLGGPEASPKAKRKTAKKRPPAQEEAACRKAVGEYIEVAYRQLTGHEYVWTVKELTGRARLAGACGNDAGEALRLLAEAKRRGEAGDRFYAENCLSPATLASCVNKLRMPAARARPGISAPPASRAEWDSIETDEHGCAIFPPRAA